MSVRKSLQCILIMWSLLVLVNVLLVVLNVGGLLLQTSNQHQLFKTRSQSHPEQKMRLLYYLQEVLQQEIPRQGGGSPKEQNLEMPKLGELDDKRRGQLSEASPKESDPQANVKKSSEGASEPSPYDTHTFVMKGVEWQNITEAWPVCLSTQTSVDLLFWVGEQVKAWTGPLSVTVFVPDSDFTIAVNMIRVLQYCHINIKKHVSFHVTYPSEFPPRYVPIERTRSLDYTCEQLEAYNEGLVAELNGTLLMKGIGVDLYPQNLLRNVARDSCQSAYVFTPDVDMVPVVGMADQMRSFLNRKDVRECKSCAFVVPTYEIHTDALRNPANKRELLQYLKKKWARRFHIKTFNPNQANSQLGIWETLGITRKMKGKAKDSLMKTVNGTLKVLYDVTSWKNLWEPVYVAEATVPPFDERFIGYGCTRSSQVYEMHLAGYRWKMLNEAFLCHRGFQGKRPKSMWPQMNRNFILYQDFMKEVQKRYGGGVAKLEQEEERS